VKKENAARDGARGRGRIAGIEGGRKNTGEEMNLKPSGSRF